jgi:NiFe hydrogenase small subunit HydA
MYYATVQDLLIANILGTGQKGDTIDLQYHPTLMSATGDLATGAISAANANAAMGFILAVEGSVQIGDPDGAGGEASAGDFCHIAETIPGIGLTSPVRMMDAVKYYATHSSCLAILSIGTCASFGGIPAGNPNPTQAHGVLDYLRDHASISTAAYTTLKAKTINIAGCPPNPNWIVGPIAKILSNVGVNPLLFGVYLDKLNRPRDYFGTRQCTSCDRYENGARLRKFINPRKADEIGDPLKRLYCLRRVGCKGPRTQSDCSLRKWHSPAFDQLGINWCVGAGAPCHACVQKHFPDMNGPQLNFMSIR